jgi:hypothetical protein
MLLGPFTIVEGWPYGAVAIPIYLLGIVFAFYCNVKLTGLF